MNEFEWKASRREEARLELVRRAAAEQKTAAEFCAAWFAMADRLGLKAEEPQSC